MTIDIERLIEEIDEDGSGEIEFDEFSIYLTGVPKLISNSNKIQKVYVARLVYTAGPLHCCEKVS